jgi:hypothetical protein
MSKYLEPTPMTKKELSCFGPDEKLKIIKQWMFEGHSYSARRDTAGYIGITDDERYWGLGNTGTDYCFIEEDIDALARKLGVL